jgi:enoyl-CoA hydratase
MSTLMPQPACYAAVQARGLCTGADLNRVTGYAFEIEAYNRTVVTKDRRQGIPAGNEQRRPHDKSK